MAKRKNMSQNPIHNTGPLLLLFKRFMAHNIVKASTLHYGSKFGQLEVSNGLLNFFCYNLLTYVPMGSTAKVRSIQDEQHKRDR